MTPVAICFPTFAEAIAAATGGAVQLPADAGPSAFTGNAPDSIQNQTVIGIDYVDPNYSGNTFTWWVDHTAGCTDGSEWNTGSMPSGWNDVISSASAWAGCNSFYHMEHIDWGGTQLICTCSTMGVMNDATSSEWWSQ